MPGQTLRLWSLLPLALGLVVWNTTLQLAGAAAGQAPPEISLEQLEGPPIALAANSGKPRVVNLWATWCPPCRREMPVLAEAARDAEDVEFLFVNQGEGPRSEERRVGKEGVGTGRSRWSPYH